MHPNRVWNLATTPLFTFALVAGLLGTRSTLADPPESRNYRHALSPIENPRPILADYPEYVAPLTTVPRLRAPRLIDDPEAEIELDAWRFSYNLKAVVELPCRLSLKHTAVLVVHPWALDDGQGLRTPDPAGVGFAGFAERNRLCHQHLQQVVAPFLKQLRGRIPIIGYSLPGTPDPIRRKLYRSIENMPTEASRAQGRVDLTKLFEDYEYERSDVPELFALSSETPVIDYFKNVPSVDAYDKYNGPGFWQMPMPLSRGLDAGDDDYVFYDGEGYPKMRDFLKEQGVRHVLLAGFHTDMCVCSTMAGYENLKRDFNTFLIGDMTQATYPAAASPQQATTVAVAKASLEVLITQRSWIEVTE